MVSVAEYTVSYEDFPFGQACAEFLSPEFEFECLKATDDSTIVYFWVSNGSAESLEEVVQTPFESLTHIDSVADDSLFRADLPDSRGGVLKCLCHIDAIVESVSRDSQQWTVRIRTESPAELSKFQRYCREQDLAVTLTRFPDLVHLYNGREFQVTEKQHEALTLAYAGGYFNQPRDVTLQELSEKLGVTEPAVLSRLQNGQRNILENTILRSVDTGL